MKKGLIGITGILSGALAGTMVTSKIQGDKRKRKEKELDKFKGYYYILNQWLSLLHENKSIATYFTKHNYKTLAIYGMGELGNRLYEELKNSEIQVKFAIDMNPLSTYSELEIKEINDSFEPVDVVVVTAIFAYDEILDAIENKFDCPIVSLEDVIEEI